MDKIDKAVEELNQYLDTFYTDAEGWMELADIYSSCHQSVPCHHLFRKWGIYPGMLDILMLFKHYRMRFFCPLKTLLHSFNLPKRLIRQATCLLRSKCF